jgi:hypothetical protein
MATHYETGHAVNVENFQRLTQYVESFGCRYAPPTDRLQTNHLHELLTAAVAALKGVDTTNPDYIAAVSDRNEAFAPLGKLATRIHYFVETLHVDEPTLNAIRELVRKLHGRRAVAKKDVPQEVHKYISVAQMSYAQRAENFEKLIGMVKHEPLYQPSAADLTIDRLNERLAHLHTTNSAVVRAHIPLLEARSHRTAILYAPLTGLVDVALDVKKYLRGALGATSDEYSEIKGIRFKRFIYR